MILNCSPINRLEGIEGWEYEGDGGSFFGGGMRELMERRGVSRLTRSFAQIFRFSLSTT